MIELRNFEKSPSPATALALAIADHTSQKAVDYPFVDQLRKAEAQVAAYPSLVEALRFYIAICGNTAYSVSRESAQEAYAKAKAALGEAS